MSAPFWVVDAGYFDGESIRQKFTHMQNGREIFPFNGDWFYRAPTLETYRIGEDGQAYPVAADPGERVPEADRPKLDPVTFVPGAIAPFANIGTEAGFYRGMPHYALPFGDYPSSAQSRAMGYAGVYGGAQRVMWRSPSGAPAEFGQGPDGALWVVLPIDAQLYERDTAEHFSMAQNFMTNFAPFIAPALAYYLAPIVTNALGSGGNPIFDAISSVFDSGSSFDVGSAVSISETGFASEFSTGALMDPLDSAIYDQIAAAEASAGYVDTGVYYGGPGEYGAASDWSYMNETAFDTMPLETAPIDTSAASNADVYEAIRQAEAGAGWPDPQVITESVAQSEILKSIPIVNGSTPPLVADAGMAGKLIQSAGGALWKYIQSTNAKGQTVATASRVQLPSGQYANVVNGRVIGSVNALPSVFQSLKANAIPIALIGLVGWKLLKG